MSFSMVILHCRFYPLMETWLFYVWIAALATFGAEPRTPLAPGRAKCNTILHLFGEWLFEAAFIGCELPQSKLWLKNWLFKYTYVFINVVHFLHKSWNEPLIKKNYKTFSYMKGIRNLNFFCSLVLGQLSEQSKRPSSIVMDSKSSLNYSQPGSMNDSSELPPGLTIDKYESGRAEALGTLCRIMCAKKTGEEILPVYLAR